MKLLNDSALNYWSLTPYTDADVDRVCQELDAKWMFARIKIGPGSMHTTISKRVADTGQGHLPTTLKFLQEVRAHMDSSLRGSFIVWLEDGLWEVESRYSSYAPILAFGRHKNDSFTALIPDPAFLGSTGYQKDLAEITELESGRAWEDKKPVIFWRGAGSNLEFEYDCWREAPRLRLCMAAKEIGRPDKFDALITKVLNYEDPAKIKRIYDTGVVGDYCPFSDFLKYRYLVDVDGFCCAWRSLFLKLASKSVVLKVQSQYIQWYHEALTPWVHYIPVQASKQYLEWLITWLEENDAACKIICEQAHSLIATATYQRALTDAARDLEQLLSRNAG